MTSNGGPEVPLSAQNKNPRRVFVLGAGASAFAGYPLASGLFDFLRELKSHDSGVQQIANSVLGKLYDASSNFERRVIRGAATGPSLESLLTYLDLYGSFKGAPFDVNPWRADDTDMVHRLVAQRFLGYQRDLALLAGGNHAVNRVHADPKGIERVSEAWAKVVQPGDVIISFNWDLLHEGIFWRAGLWSYRDGYGFQCGNQGRFDPISKILLLKLHGSVNWVQASENSEISEIANVSDFFPDSADLETREHFHQSQTDSGRRLVLPTYIKDVSANPALLGLWTKAHQIIANANELLIIGYSLNPADIAARLLIGTAVTDNLNLKEIQVVTTAAVESPRSFGKPVNLVQTRFEDWVLQSSCNRTS